MTIEVAGKPLPRELTSVAGSPKWTEYTEEARLDPTLVERVFGEQPDSTWRFYRVEEIKSMTSSWQEEYDAGWFGEPPDDLDPESSVLIGELGYDRPFALDYRMAVPAVRLMCLDSRWRLVAASAPELLGRLGILPEESAGPNL